MKKVVDFIAGHNMLNGADTVLAAVSGGADSVCMLHILIELSKNTGFSVYAAHFNHLLRGEESDRDEAFVKKLCKELDVHLYCGSGNVKEYAAAHSIGTEEAAREMRYSFLRRTAESVNAAKIATAHNADDNAETVILNLTRGAGLAGLRGIPPVRDNIIRPILCLTRTEIEEYLAKHGIEYVTDSTNLEDIYTRNKLRHHVMPVIRELNPRFSENLIGTCEILRQDEDFLSAEADRIISQNARGNRISADVLLSLHKSISARVVRKMANGATALQTEDILALCKNTSPSAEIHITGMKIHREYSDIVFGSEDISEFSTIVLEENTPVVIPELNLEITLEKAVFTDNIHKSFTEYLFKTIDVYGKISIRPRKTGDSIKLRGTNCTKSVKKLFIEKRIPSALRKQIPIIADERGVLGIYGIGCDNRGTPSLGDKIYKIQIKEIAHL